jgi:adenylate kinase family enzyme
MNVMKNLRRTIVIGTSCAGKTTFAGDLAARLGTAHIELDRLHWLPDWQARPNEEFRDLVREAIKAERWVVDGNYSKVRDITWKRATSIVWLDYSFAVVFGRALRRSLRRMITQEELFAGNKESFRKTFLARDSILLWVLMTYRRRRREYPELFSDPNRAHLEIHRLLKPSAASRFLEKISSRSTEKD